MSTLAERLRGVVRPPSGVRPVPAMGAAVGGTSGARVDGRDGGARIDARATRATSDVTEVLGGEWDDAAVRRFATIDRVYLPGYRHGATAMAEGLPPVGGWSRLHLLAGVPCGERLIFVDLETTGLAGGAGTQAFLVGCAWFDGGTFRVRQFLLTSARGERAMLEAVAVVAGAFDTVVTYNGKSFDLPLIETRYLFQRMETPFAGKAHVDMLHAARRLWRSDDAFSSGCRLSEIERTMCGYERDGDVSGFEVPTRYFHYVRTGDASPLSGVLEHNRLDLISLALLTARAAQLLCAGPSRAGSAREALGLGRLYARGGLSAEARESFARASGTIDPASGINEACARAEALRALAVLARRERQHEAAADAWRGALALPGCPAHILREASEALAVHHEHRLGDARTAHGFALRSLEGQESRIKRQSLERRVARLCRKIEPRLC